MLSSPSRTRSSFTATSECSAATRSHILLAPDDVGDEPARYCAPESATQPPFPLNCERLHELRHGRALQLRLVAAQRQDRVHLLRREAGAQVGGRLLLQQWDRFGATTT